ncbi:MAG: bifunctional 4-hydroxy-2-oxoglutarate aldolase/2-dehydro-3-deoxy-phosphogluconate aldolase [Thermodesulfobacteriota bacterium]
MDLFKTNKIISVVRFDEKETSIEFANACIGGGIRLIEVIVTRPDAQELIKILSENNDISVGAGTVLDLKSAEQAYSSGAKFIVSPHTDPQIIEFAKSKNLVSIAGAFTSSEIVKATKLGADYVKIFPASSVGPKYIKAVKGALPFVNILVTGGINMDNVNDYIISGASLLGISTALTGNIKTFDSNTVTSNARKFIEALNISLDK